MYHEPESGLGPEEAQFESRVLAGALKTQVWAERWMSHVWRWEDEGRPVSKPPGVANLTETVRKEPGINRDYHARLAVLSETGGGLLRCFWAHCPEDSHVDRRSSRSI